MSQGLDAALRLVRAQATLVKRFDASLGGLHGVSDGFTCAAPGLQGRPGL